MPPVFHRIIAAQFLSSLADNALLIVTIALLQRTGAPPWWAPMLKFFFITAYVVLAPVIGPWSDAVPKTRLMAWMNALKLAGAIALCAGAPPLLAFAVIGIGSAAYAPAKYGLITEVIGADRLVAANAWIEVTVVAAVLLGSAGGGYLISDAFAGSALSQALAEMFDADGARHSGLAPAMLLLLAVYAASAVVNPRGRHGTQPAPAALPPPSALVQQFMQGHRLLWRDAGGGRLSLGVTSLFWGAAAVLQFAVLQWATDQLGLSLAAAAYLQAAVAVGLIAGAWTAGRLVSLHQAPRMLHAGVVLGLLVTLGSLITDVVWATALMVCVGAVGGVLMVPMNALLQHRGCQLLTAGRSIAVQGFNENPSVLLLLGVYALLLWLQVPITPLMTGFGLAIAAAMGWIGWRFRSAPVAALAQPAALRR